MRKIVKKRLFFEFSFARSLVSQRRGRHGLEKAAWPNSLPFRTKVAIQGVSIFKYHTFFDISPLLAHLLYSVSIVLFIKHTYGESCLKPSNSYSSY
jgi:hypothetical protein